jgi:putative ABC transport system substrate-binding protein
MRLIGLAVVLAFSITLAPLVGAPQSGGVRRIGVLMGAYVPTNQEGQTALATFLNTLEGFGWAAGRNTQIEVRWMGEEVAQAKAQAAELVGLAPDVIFCSSSLATDQLSRLTRTTPIVFAQVADPVGSGWVKSYAATRQPHRLHLL